jgi:hypothetical protein
MQGHKTDNARVVIQRAQELRDRARRLRKEASKACKRSMNIQRVLFVTGEPLTRSTYEHRDYVRLSDVLDRILDTGIMVEPWRRLTPTGIHLPVGKSALKATSIQTYLLNEELANPRRKRLQLPSAAGHELGILRPASFLDMLDRILDKGIVLDSWQQIDMLGVDVLGVETHVVPVSIQIHLLYESALVPEELPRVKAASASA